jgi:hypothetical protein
MKINIYKEEIVVNGNELREFFAFPNHLKFMLEGNHTPGKTTTARQVEG